jgi:hypothetical protein
MNGSIRRTTLGLAIAIGTLGIGGAAVDAAGTGFTAPGSTPPPPPRSITLVTAPPEKSTTCEGNDQCGLLQGACDLVGGTYNGWHSTDPGHDHEHGVCTWPWE